MRKIFLILTLLVATVTVYIPIVRRPATVITGSTGPAQPTRTPGEMMTPVDPARLPPCPDLPATPIAPGGCKMQPSPARFTPQPGKPIPLFGHGLPHRPTDTPVGGGL